MSKVKPNKQVVIDSIIDLIKKKQSRAVICAKIWEKVRIKSRAFDNYWKEANIQYKEVQEIAKEAANKAYVDGKVEAAKEALMSEKEAQDLTSKIARGNLADYMVVRKSEYTPTVQISLSEYISRKLDEIEFEREYAESIEMDADDLDNYEREQKRRRNEIVRLKLELQRNPKATRFVHAEPIWREVAELDLVKLIKDKELGKIKSFANTKEGIKVEMYGADSALVNVLRMHGSFEKDNEQGAPKIDLSNLPIVFK